MPIFSKSGNIKYKGNFEPRLWCGSYNFYYRRFWRKNSVHGEDADSLLVCDSVAFSVLLQKQGLKYKECENIPAVFGIGGGKSGV